MSEYIERLTEAIEAVHECRATHFGSEHVVDVSGSETIWEGDVEIFHLEDHPDAKVAYGWAWEGLEGDIDYVGILKLPPVKTPLDAVKVAIASGTF